MCTYICMIIEFVIVIFMILYYYSIFIYCITSDLQHVMTSKLEENWRIQTIQKQLTLLKRPLLKNIMQVQCIPAHLLFGTSPSRNKGKGATLRPKEKVLKAALDRYKWRFGRTWHLVCCDATFTLRGSNPFLLSPTQPLSPLHFFA